MCLPMCLTHGIQAQIRGWLQVCRAIWEHLASNLRSGTLQSVGKLAKRPSKFNHQTPGQASYGTNKSKGISNERRESFDRNSKGLPKRTVLCLSDKEHSCLFVASERLLHNQGLFLFCWSLSMLLDNKRLFQSLPLPMEYGL